MLTFDEFERMWNEAPPLPQHRGTVQHLVVRVRPDEHEEPARITLSPQRGVHGDRWSLDGHPDGQVTLMMLRVAELCGADRPLHLAGDNLLVNLDLAEALVPPGTRLRAGSALLEVTDRPHLGCHKFKARFGEEALRWVNHKPHRTRHLRGVHARVIEPGEVALGDAIARVE